MLSVVRLARQVTPCCCPVMVTSPLGVVLEVCRLGLVEVVLRTSLLLCDYLVTVSVVTAC